MGSTEAILYSSSSLSSSSPLSPSPRPVLHPGQHSSLQGPQELCEECQAEDEEEGEKCVEGGGEDLGAEASRTCPEGDGPYWSYPEVLVPFVSLVVGVVVWQNVPVL